MALPLPVVATNPVVDIWYGNPQPFGHIGNPQNWVNILGTVSDPDGIQSLTYTLNGGVAQNLSIGPDTRRLLEAGDFNVEIDMLDLVAGANTVEITAVDTLANMTVTNVTLDYTDGLVWPFSYTADWSTASVISDVAQVVDGKWSITPGGLRTDVMGYDRTFVIGDLGWSDYEVEVPITVHDIDPGGFVWPSVSPGVGFTSRWTGHTTLIPGEQPHAFWQPSGGGAWYDAGNTLLRLFGSTGGGLLLEDPGRTLLEDVEYIWKLRLESMPDGTTFYGMKVWEQGQVEPGTWDFSGTDAATGLLNGSTIFVAHHVDATFGNIEVTDLVSDTDPPVISNVQDLHGQTSALIRWNTDEPSIGSVDYGLTTGYEIGSVSQPNSAINHSVLLTSLVPGNTYYYRVNATDGRSNTGSVTGSFLFTGTSSIMSDDFSDTTLDTSIWSFVDPLSDATLTMTGTQAQISMPATNIHDVWTGINTLPRLRQTIADEDFEIEVKFESQPVQSFQSQGILIEEADTVVLRFEFHQVNGQNKVFAASIVPTAQTILSETIGLTNPMYLRVGRSGNTWTMRYSSDGQAWTEAVTFVQALTPAAISVYGGNADVANTATIDYLFNVAAPIIPEDGALTVDTAALPDGTVAEIYAAQTLVASGGTLPYSWSIISGALPPGLSMNTAGEISGTPTTETGSPFNFEVQVEDATLATATRNLSITVTPPPLPVILPATLPVGAVGVPYVQTMLNGAGGTPPYIWSITAGALPPGLSLSPAGLISGTPTSDVGSPFAFTVELEDDDTNTAIENFSITILDTPPPTLVADPLALPAGAAGQVYASQNLTVTGGYGPFAWTITSGALPDGLSLSADGVISGTPATEVGSPFAFTAEVTDAMLSTDTESYSISVAPPPSSVQIDPILPVNGQVGVLYPDQTLTATGGLTPYSWSVISGALPPGLSLSPLGVISGTPTDDTGSPYNFTVEVTDAGAPASTDTLALSIAINAVPELLVDVNPLTAKPAVEPPINRHFPGMAAAGGVAEPTSRLPLFDDADMFNDETDLNVGNTGGGIINPNGGEPYLEVNPGFITHFPHWLSPEAFTLQNPDWTMFLDFEILNTEGDFPAMITQRNSAGPGFWQMNRAANGTDMVFGWKVGAVWSELVFTNGWPGAGRHQIVLTRDDGTFTYYLDGVQIGLQFNGNPLPAPTLDHDVLLGVLELVNFTQNRVEANFHNVWVNMHHAISPADVAALQVNPWQIYADTVLTGGVQDQAYAGETLTASGGVGPYAWQVVAGALPPGLTLGGGGQISGTPTAASETPYEFTVEVTDSMANTAQQTFTIEVDYPPLSLTALYPPQKGTKNQFYYWGGLSASGGKPPYTFALSGGWLPWPLQVNAFTGVIMGVPQSPETTFFTIEVTDDNGDTATYQSSIIIQSPAYVCGACHGDPGF